MKNNTKYIRSYNKSHYDLLQVYCAKGTKERLKTEAEKQGISLAQLIVRSIESYTGITLSKELENDNETESQ